MEFPLEETCIQSFFPKKTTLMYPKPHDKSLRKQESFGQHRCIVFFVQIPVVSRCYLNKYAIINGVFHKFEIEDQVGRAGGGGYFRNFWVGMCCWDPGILNLYQS